MEMNSQTSLLLIKNKWRLTKGILRHYGIPLVALFGSIGFGGYHLILALQTAVGQYSQYINALVVFCCLLRVFFSKTPVYKMNSAIVLYTYNSDFFPKHLRKKKIRIALGGSLVALFVSLISYRFEINGQMLLDYLKLTLFVQNSFLLAWFFFHESGTRKFLILPVFGAMIPLLFTDHVFSLLIVVVITILLIVYDSRFLVLNMTKYEDKLRFLDEVMTAQSQNNYADMLRIAEENRPSTVKGVGLHILHPNPQTAVFAKSLLDFSRMHKRIWVMIFTMFVVGYLLQSGIIVVLFQISIDTASINIISALCTMMAFQSLFQAGAKHATTFIEKSRLGLLLPYTKWQVLWGYYPTVLLISIIFALILDLFYRKLTLLSLVFLLQICLTSGMLLYFKIFPGKIGKAFSIIINFLFYIGVMMHYGFYLGV